MRVLWRTRLPLALVSSGVATLAYASLIERTKWTLRRFDVPVLAPGSAPLSILHISDIHLTAPQRSKQRWLRSLVDLNPDLVVCTGDNIAGFDAVPPALDALGPLLERPGAFVLGSNDYYAPRPKNPLKYFWKNHRRVVGIPLPWEPLRDGFVAAGWLDLTNTRGCLTVAGRRIAFAGVGKYSEFEDLRIAGVRLADVRGPRGRPAVGVVPLTGTPGTGPVRGRRVRPDPVWPHPRRPVEGSWLRRVGDQLRHRPDPGPVAAPVGSVLPARVGRTGHLAVRAVPVRLPARGDPADPGGAA